MSEHQHYEFLAVDRTLTGEEMAVLRRYSTRASITPTRFHNTYQWGSFKGNENLWMAKYFDVFAYFANWGTRTIKVSVPITAFDETVLAEFERALGSALHKKEDRWIITLNTEEQGEDFWYDELDDDVTCASCLAASVSLRADLLDGGTALLYLAWLTECLGDDVEEGALEPPLPLVSAGTLANLRIVAEFMGVDDSLIAVTLAANQTTKDEAEPSIAMIEDWVKNLSIEECRGAIASAIRGDNAAVGELCRRFRKSHRGAVEPNAKERRTVDEIFELAQDEADRREAEALAEIARQELAREEAKAAARENYLKSLVGKEAEVWNKIEALAEKKNQTAYAEIVTLIEDLDEILERSGRALFLQRLTSFQVIHQKKKRLMEMLEEFGL